MKKYFILTLFIISSNFGYAQNTFVDSILSFQENYKKAFLTDEESPVKREDLQFLRFFKPDINYRVIAKFKRTPKEKPFEMDTHSGKTKNYIKYGEVTFLLEGREQKLNVYQSMDLIKTEEHKNDLFIPFKDLTNYESTYGGGRYLDFTINDIIKNTLMIDFNKAYNPYCAYASGYSCPIPPEENKMKAKVLAGERNYRKPGIEQQ